MSLAAEVLAYLAAQGLGSLTTPITLFENAMPESPDVCGAVFTAGGGAPDLGFGVQGIQYENPSVQVRFRGVADDDTGPGAKAVAAYQALAKVQAQTLSGCLYLMVRPIQAPFIMMRDESRRVVWVFNASVSKVPS